MTYSSFLQSLISIIPNVFAVSTKRAFKIPTTHHDGLQYKLITTVRQKLYFASSCSAGRPEVPGQESLLEQFACFNSLWHQFEAKTRLHSCFSQQRVPYCLSLEFRMWHQAPWTPIEIMAWLPWPLLPLLYRPSFAHCCCHYKSKRRCACVLISLSHSEQRRQRESWKSCSFRSNDFSGCSFIIIIPYSVEFSSLIGECPKTKSK